MSKQRDPFAVRMVFLRIGWMQHYRGVGSGDSISGGGAYVAEHGFGHEMFNFLPFRGAVYGYARPVSTNERWMEATINLNRIDESAGDESLSDVLAVWVATAPTGGGYVVGWYANATVYRNVQPPPADPKRRHKDKTFHYYATASEADAVLLQPDARLLEVPRGSGGMGKSNVWYADDHKQHRQFRLDVLRFVEKRRLPAADTGGAGPRQPDPLLRQKVEQAAVQVTTAHFARLGYTVDSVEKDNVGWDLDATRGRRALKLEVKGLSGSQVVVDLTPNEYAAMKDYPDTYRVCVVTDALTAPRLEVFARSPESGQWESTITRGRVLAVQEIVAARCTAN
jgi:hypothetical protein